MPQTRTFRNTGPVRRNWYSAALLACALILASAGEAETQTALQEQLSKLPFKIAYETYIENNWEIFAVNADGSDPVNLTRTPNENEHYPQISPDGTKICFSVDKGEGRDAVRSLCLMDIDGKNRKKLVDRAREPFWSPDGRVIGFLPQEYPKFSVTDYYTKGMSFYDLASGRVQPHPNTAHLFHLYNPSFAPNGKWIVCTVHAGMGFDHAIIAVEAHGDKIVNLQIPGCRPCLSPDGRQIAWGADDHQIVAAAIDLDSDVPSVGNWRLRVRDLTNETYHVDWSPDSRFLSFSRGPEGEGDPSKPGTFQAACPMVGVYAPGWNVCVVPADRSGTIDLSHATGAELLMLTTNGLSNKESAWFRPRLGATP